MAYWLMKSEPGEMSIEDALKLPAVPWFGVRNYQARNFMRDRMQIGDGVLFYHSSCATPGIAGIAKVASHAYPDDTQFDTSSKYFDPKSTLENPRWMMVDIQAVCQTRLLSLTEMRDSTALQEMQVLQKASRLSITPVSPDQWNSVMHILGHDPITLDKIARPA